MGKGRVRVDTFNKSNVSVSNSWTFMDIHVFNMNITFLGHNTFGEDAILISQELYNNKVILNLMGTTVKQLL